VAKTGSDITLRLISVSIDSFGFENAPFPHS
jgi:hypothetical protein